MRRMESIHGRGWLGGVSNKCKAQKQAHLHKEKTHFQNNLPYYGRYSFMLWWKKNLKTGNILFFFYLWRPGAPMLKSTTYSNFNNILIEIVGNNYLLEKNAPL